MACCFVRRRQSILKAMTKLYPEFFRRTDESPDALFYQHPRFVSHIDAQTSEEAKRLYDELLPAGGRILDLMASYHSHLSDKFAHVAGLGLNWEELEHNPSIHEHIIHDLNKEVKLPLEDNSLDGVVCTVSVQYMVHPIDTFTEIARSLKPGAPFIVTFSNRMFPTKAVLAWRSSDDAAHVRLVRSYFEQIKDFSSTYSQHYCPEEGDPLYAVWAYKQ